MPGFPATYDRVTLRFRNTSSGSHANVVLWYEVTAGPSATLATVATHANAFRTAFLTAIPPTITADCEMYAITLKHVASGSEVEGDNTNGGMAGTAASGDTLPEEDVACIQRRTGLVGRSKRGRIFWPYMPESFQADGELNATAITAYTAVANMIKNNVTTGATTYEPRHFDRKNTLLIKVVQAGVVLQVCSRRDRRSPKVLQSLRV